MKGKIGYRLFVIYFFIICCIPVGFMAFIPDDLSENRDLSSFPDFVTEDGFNTDFFNEFSTYISEHFAFRGKLVALDSEIKYRLLHSPSDSQVILGKNGWYFFDATLDDYAGVTLKGEELEQIAENLKEVCEGYEALGKKPLIMLVPNKNAIYPEYMPTRFGTKVEENNRIKLQALLKQKNVPYLDVASVLLEGKESDEVYLHQDTHWNNTGARLVMNAMYQKLGIDITYSLDDYVLEDSHESDLGKILFPTKENLETQRIYPQLHEFSYEKKVRSMDDISIISHAANGNGTSIFLYRDSFGRAMIPYMAEYFDTCYFNRSTPYDVEKAAQTDCDYVVIEIVERNIPDLAGIAMW